MVMCVLCKWGKDLFNVFLFFKQKTAYEMRISDWSSDVCSSDLTETPARQPVDIVPLDRRRAPPGAGRAEHALSKQNVEIGDLATRSHAADRPARRPRLPRQAGADRAGKPPCLLVAIDRKCVVEGRSWSVRLDPIG